MSLTSNQLISDIRGLATSGSNPVDFRIEDSQILFWCNQSRSKFISQAVQKNQELSDVWIQNITCLELMQVDESECCEVTTGCTVLRTVLQIPETVEVRASNMIIAVTKPNGDVIPRTNIVESKYARFSKYTKKKARWFLRNKYIYIINEDFLESINISAIFETPSDLSLYTSCSGSTCFDLDSSYPCSQKMADDITNYVFKAKVYPFMQMPQDNSNNANNDIQGVNDIKQ
jgi:hypothetical protein